MLTSVCCRLCNAKDDLKSVSTCDPDDLIQDCGMKVGHAKKLLKHLTADMPQPGSKLPSDPAEGAKPAEVPPPDRSARWFYRVLEIHRGATFEEIKKAYRRLALINHPDKGESTGSAR